jgi:hypothetical protein
MLERLSETNRARNVVIVILIVIIIVTIGIDFTARSRSRSVCPSLLGAGSWEAVHARTGEARFLHPVGYFIFQQYGV